MGFREERKVLATVHGGVLYILGVCIHKMKHFFFISDQNEMSEGSLESLLLAEPSDSLSEKTRADSSDTDLEIEGECLLARLPYKLFPFPPVQYLLTGYIKQGTKDMPLARILASLPFLAAGEELCQD